MLIPPGPFDYEKHALRWILKRLLGEDQDLETLCKLVPKIANSVANLARSEASVIARQQPQEPNAVLAALRELIDERADVPKEETQW